MAVPAIGVQSFRWSLENDKWQGRANTIKAAHEAAAKDLGEAEGQPEGLPGAVEQGHPRHPRPVRLPEHDPPVRRPAAADPQRRKGPELPPRGGAKIAFASAEAAYKARRREDKLKIMVAKDVGHSVTAEQQKAALDWFEKWLKGK